MPSQGKGESFFQKRIGLILGSLTFLILVVVVIYASGIDLATLTQDPQKLQSWETYIQGNWAWTDRDGGDQIFQFNADGSYSFFLRISAIRNSVGQWKLLRVDDETAVIQIIPDADRSAKAKIFMKKINQDNMDIRMGDAEGDEYTRLTRQ